MRAGAIRSPACQWTASSPVCRGGWDLLWLGFVDGPAFACSTGDADGAADRRAVRPSREDDL